MTEQGEALLGQMYVGGQSHAGRLTRAAHGGYGAPAPAARKKWFWHRKRQANDASSIRLIGRLGTRLRIVALLAGPSLGLSANAAEPRVLSFAPAATVPGETLVLHGSGFTGTTAVLLADWRGELAPV